MEPAASINVAVQPRRHISSGGDHVISGSGEARQRRTSTREKIARMVAEGATNYPSYLKLIYTGDSEEPSSSEDELVGDRRTASGGGSRGARGGSQGRRQLVSEGGRTVTSSVEAGHQQTAKTMPWSRNDDNCCQTNSELS